MAILEAAATEPALSGLSVQPVPVGSRGQRVSTRGTVTIDQAMEGLRKRCPEPIPDPRGVVAIVREIQHDPGYVETVAVALRDACAQARTAESEA